MKSTAFLVLSFFLLLNLSACKKEKAVIKIPPQPIDISLTSIIPVPVSLEASNSSLAITPGTTIFVDSTSKELYAIGKLLKSYLSDSIHVEAFSGSKQYGNIYLTLADSIEHKEGYILNINEDYVELTANQPEGVFRGVQTIRQLLPVKINDSVQHIGTGRITDYPNYEYRGAMLDVARHFFSVEDVKTFIDWLAYYKMNILHLHLTDDQGWRIEIKSWPNLTAHGGQTAVGGGKGGFFTQEDYKEIIKYAEERYITIVPEVDMPGHTNAALSSYAELNCDGKAPEMYTKMKVGFSTLCTDKDITYKFLDDVIGEIASITPGPYFHIGGDESHATKLKDYIFFINKAQDIVHKHGKRVIGWDEITHATLKENTVVQYWNKAENTVKGVEQGAKVIMSPAPKAYLDMKYNKETELGLGWAGYIEVDTAYIWNPAKLEPEIKRDNILGLEAPLWSETVTNIEEVGYMVFPRLAGYAEIGWSQDSLRNWDEYKLRLAKHADRLKALKINYYKSEKIPWED
ncbi:beta-N-acetylhexosaminidase [Abyssalbus ytuae]|uniref:beta-N-acetylhexosaminidase n=1 Tax=Abyssalbus ytuae TaxID=2926907 RepID=A0A9E7CZ12_9FLAO|nr:beta-N-acetylhexosaminidase [Abyssalbus ytuae]UOB17170.1 beta-N-acetylhexosaminidase [Abyssalbus ytuae]